MKTLPRKQTDGGDTLQLVLVDTRYDARSHHLSLRVWSPAARNR